MDDTDLSSLKDSLEAAILVHAHLARAESGDTESLLQLVRVTGKATRICSDFQRSAVQQARRSEVSWVEIGDALGVSKQAAQQRFGLSDIETSGDIRVIKDVTAFDEMAVLAEEGKSGFHLVGFGAFTLLLKPSGKTWLHSRELGINVKRIRRQKETAGWEYVGSWFPFHYFKKPTAA
ncbi:DUF2812 domain-containing protein [Stenotrophomonas sp. NLF4-10]|uniref:DUF2812 domain-containing protein n=1 Tax=Stenotrophomonas sp. NLF4-10 TaxID=2918754 RepID=UPI001EFAE187|nr:DUF2812 domain-containing protein [Stenotrophomonas sp. NLF4-10]MCG8275987.1 DUF2812 domain-containing protein [Stenotrophomonas sp. NLF4-10]